MLWKFFKRSTLIEKQIDADPGKISSTTLLPLALLQKLIPIGGLPVEKLRTLNVGLRNFEPGEIIFTRGDQTDSLPYLQAGEIFLEAGNGSGYNVDSSTFKACYPLSTESEHKFTAFARTTVRIIYIPLQALNEHRTQINHPAINQETVPPELKNSSFFKKFCNAYQKDELRVPSLPDVALRLRSALQKEINIADAVKIINLDPVIAAKLIQVVNSPIYRSLNTTATCFDAVNRLGLKTTQNLVISLSLNNLFISADKKLHNRIQTVWKQSIQVASLSYILANISHKLNADEALLAGLIHNIGALPVITFAESLDKNSYSESELEETIAFLQNSLGEYILKKWRFPMHLQHIPMQASNWYYDNGNTFQLNDLVLLAKFHSLLGTAHMQKLPPLNTLPSFHKFGDTALTPDMSLQVLQDAKQHIAEALNFFRV